MTQRSANQNIIILGAMLLLLFSGCSQAPKSEGISSPSLSDTPPKSYDQLDASFAAISDQKSAEQAAQDFESYVNRKCYLLKFG